MREEREAEAGLNPQQLEAVLADQGPVIIVAGPGSGKTRVLTHRIRHLVETRGVRGDQILAITFTNRAAGEMSTRTTEMLGGSGRGVRTGTFHRLCGNLLRTYPGAAGLKDEFTVYDRDDQEQMVKRAAEIAQIRQAGLQPRDLLDTISFAKAHVLDAEGLAKRLKTYRGAKRDTIIELVDAYAVYEPQMNLCGAIDLDDMIAKTVVMLEGRPAIRAACQRRFRHIMIDEFQDTNEAQYRLARALAGEEGNLCVVGDPDQAIYGWRHADIGNILNFRRDFPNARQVELNDNYRSTQAIVESARAMIEHNRERIEHPLRAVGPQGGSVIALTGSDERDEAEQVIRWLQETTADTGLSMGECAVMYRTHRQARAIEEQCVREGVAYRVIGGPRFYDRAEIRDCLAYLKLIHNPGDDVAFTRAVTTPRRGVGATSLERMSQWAAEQRATMMQSASAAVDEMAFGATGPRLPKRTQSALRVFTALMSAMESAARSRTLTDLLETVLEESGLGQHIRQDRDGPARWDNVEELKEACAQYEDGGAAMEGALAQWLAEIATVTQADTDTTNTLTLTTLHQSKGTEFTCVAITGLEHGTLPLWRSDDTEEERRLCYVGMTRAKRHLAVTWACQRNGRDSMPSQFLDEMANLWWADG